MKVSIITVTYNSSKTIADTVKSVFSQTYDDIEHIIIDGASSDNTVEVIGNTPSRVIKIVSEKDGGLYEAMNKGISMSTGDIIGFLNSDDFFTSDSIISEIVDSFRSNSSLDAVYGDVHYVNPNNLNKTVRYYSSANFKPWKMKFGYMPAHPSFYCKRELYNKYGGFDETFKIAADFELLLRFIFIHKINTKYISLDFVTMRTGGVSTSGLSTHKQIMIEHLKAYRKNAVSSNIVFDSSRYIFKILDVFTQRVSDILFRC